MPIASTYTGFYVLKLVLDSFRLEKSVIDEERKDMIFSEITSCKGIKMKTTSKLDEIPAELANYRS